MKRPASASVGKRTAKRGRPSSAEQELATKCDSIAKVLRGHHAIPSSMREVLSLAVEHSLSLYQEDRHDYHHFYVDSIGKALENVKVSMQEEIASNQTLVDGADAAKVELEAAEQEAIDTLGKLQTATAEAKSILQADQQAVKDLRLASVAKGAHADKPEVVKVEMKKVALEAALKEAFAPTKEKLMGSETLGALDSVSQTLGLHLKSENSFGSNVAAQMEEMVNKKITDMASELLMSSAEAKCVSSREAYFTACTALREGEKDLIAKSRAVANRLPGLKKVADQLDFANAAYAEFLSGPMQAYIELKEFAPPPPAPPEPEPTAEPEVTGATEGNALAKESVPEVGTEVPQ